jgi:hypothetical protein
MIAPGTLHQFAAIVLAVQFASCNHGEPPPEPRQRSVDQVIPVGDALHADYSRFLARWVTPAGDVDYAGIHASSTARAELDNYLALLDGQLPAELATREQRLAYWINAYNAFTLDLLLDNYPLASIKDLPDDPLRGYRRWKAAIHLAGGQRISLDAIEHKILRVEFNEPRIHFAIVCASRSCPKLRNEAYVATRIEEQLADQTRAFLDDRFRGLHSADQGRTLRISSLFQWFSDDFVAAEGAVLAFLLKHSSPETRALIAAAGRAPQLRYLDYDWSLNGK